MAEPLLPQDYPTNPFINAGPFLRDPSRLGALAEELGYLFFDGFIAHHLLDPIRSFIRSFAINTGWILPENSHPNTITASQGARLLNRGWDDPQWIELQRVVNILPPFHELIHQPNILEALAVIYGEPAAPAATNMVWLKLPGSPEHTTRPHRDGFYLPTCPRMWTVWVPLTDTPMEVGPLAVIRGSHRSPSLEQKDAMAGIEVPRHTHWATQEVKAGDVVFFNAGTIHCAWSNISPTAVRLALDLRYEPASTKDSILRPNHRLPPP
jgi:ectoine hydroxylase-related dioxygenase (phytanoyl-CoA dioxygenase family)